MTRRFLAIVVIFSLFSGVSFAQEISSEGRIDNSLKRVLESDRFIAKTTFDELKSVGLDKIELQPGIVLNLDSYLERSRLTAQERFLPLSQKANGLLKTPDYTETLYRFTDRIIVDRVLNVSYDPKICDSKDKSELFDLVCFTKNPKAESLPKELDLTDVRSRLAKQPKREAFPGMSAAEALKLSDEDLFGKILNSGEREFRLISEHPLRVETIDAPFAIDGFVNDPRESLMLSPLIETGNIETIDPDSARLKSTPDGFPRPAPTSDKDALRKIDHTDVDRTDLMGIDESKLKNYFRQKRLQDALAERADRSIKTRLTPNGLGQAAVEEAIRNRRALDGTELPQNVVDRIVASQNPDHYLVNSTETDHFLFGQSTIVDYGDTYDVTFARSTWFTDKYYASLTWHVGFGYGVRLAYKMVADQVRRYELVGSDGLDPVYDLARTKTLLKVSPVDPRPNNIQAYADVGLDRSNYKGGQEFVLFAEASVSAYASIPGPNIRLGPARIGEDFGSDFMPPLGFADRTLLAEPTLPASVSGLGVDAWVGKGGVDLSARIYMGNASLGFQARPVHGSFQNNVPSPQRFIISDPDQTWSRTIVSDSHNTSSLLVNNPSFSSTIDIVPTVTPFVGFDFGVYEWNKRWPLEISDLTVSFDTGLTPHAGTEAYATFDGQN